MSSFLIQREDYNDAATPEGMLNLNKLITSFESVLHVLENPYNTTYCFIYQNDRCDGVQPNAKVFETIINHHFDMSLKRFFQGSDMSDDIFIRFEDECYFMCAHLLHGQVSRVYNKLLFNYESLELL